MSRSKQPQPNVLIISEAIAAQAVLQYNAASYKGCRNTDLDRAGYKLFRCGLSDDDDKLVEQLKWVATCYGGVRGPIRGSSIAKEACCIAGKLKARLGEWRAKVKEARPLVEAAPDEGVIELLLRPFTATKRWPVWAAKVLHFMRPDAFPILDSRAERALGLSRGSDPVKHYARFCSAFREAMLANQAALEAARVVDNGPSPSDLKLLDKILFEMGKGGKRRQGCGSEP